MRSSFFCFRFFVRDASRGSSGRFYLHLMHRAWLRLRGACVYFLGGRRAKEASEGRGARTKKTRPVCSSEEEKKNSLSFFLFCFCFAFLRPLLGLQKGKKK